MNTQYYFDQNQFVIKQYDTQKPFASFLPGIAGKKGIPMWSFYVNRGQGMASFGLKDKNGPILEFSPANIAYLNTDRIGFKTFLKIDGVFVEAFSNTQHKLVERNMRISRSYFQIEEINQELKYHLIVTYFTLPNAPLAGLVRRVTLTDLSGTRRKIELADGLNELIPLGISNGVFKEMANLFRSFIEVIDLDQQFAFFKVKSSTGDTAEVRQVEEGSFYISYVNGKLTKPLVDAELLYTHDTSLTTPNGFLTHSATDIMNQTQIYDNKVPCGFVLHEGELPKNGTIHIHTLIGAAKNDKIVLEMMKQFSPSYFDQKFTENIDEIEQLLDRVTTKTAFPLFDEYIKQNQLDNLLRGGFPMIITSKDNRDFVYHLYSRKHGDLERDYNFFVIEPEYYSQGNSNFRDVCQNRRNDVLLEPRVYDFNVQMFANLIQLDGYNPLSIMGVKYKYKGNVSQLCNTLFHEKASAMEDIFKTEFSPGDVINRIREENILLDRTDEELFAEIFQNVDVHYQATFGEGYWIDHFTYILDLVDNVLGIYPDKTQDIVFNTPEYKYFVSPATVYPKSEKMLYKREDDIVQYGAINHYDKEKVQKQHLSENSNWLRDQHGVEVYTNLYGKLFVLLLNKISLLDPFGHGIEMEAGKPGWNDAMNGLPGLFGSGTSETFELYRIATFLEKVGREQKDQTIPLFSEFVAFMDAVDSVLELDSMDYWKETNSIRKTYLEQTRFGISETTYVDIERLQGIVGRVIHKLNKAINEIKQLDESIVPTFLTYRATDTEFVLEHGEKTYSHYGLPKVQIHAFAQELLPPFLEAPARILKISHDMEYNKRLYKNIQQSGIYDDNLHMYKTSADLDHASFKIGRIKAFSKGWLERESNFLHMTYKYLLGLLKSGLYEEFYNDIETNLVCFMDPSVYGRSILENSSFIATSNNPNPRLHGQGFVSRLSGSTAEMLSIWAYMMIGSAPFVMKDNELTLHLNPKLKYSWFDENKQVTFQFLNTVQVTYVAQTELNTYDIDARIERIDIDGERYPSVVISGEMAHKIRNGEVKQLKIYWTK